MAASASNEYAGTGVADGRSGQYEGGHARQVGSLQGWWFGYVAFSGVLSVVGAIRLVWSWPDVTWLSQLWFIDDIDKIVNGDLSGANWFVVGGEHAMSAYRWFLYANATFFGLDSRLEIWAYFAITLALSVGLGLRMRDWMQREGAGGWPLILPFAVPLILNSMVGAGSRGMELGQYFGMGMAIGLILLVESRIQVRWFAAMSFILVPIITVTALGGYVAAPALALSAVSLLQYWRSTCTHLERVRLHLLTAAFVGSAALWAVLMLSSGSLGGEESSAALPDSGDGVAFAVKYLLGGAAASVISSQTLEVANLSLEVALAVGALVAVFTLLTAWLALRRTPNGATAPLVLTLVGPSLALVLMFGRNDDVYWLLSPWYGLLFRCALVGVVMLVVHTLAVHSTSSAGQIRTNVVVLLPLLAMIILATVWANYLQWTRQPFERAYFENIRSTYLNPESLSEDENGLTQLVLPMRESERAIEILRRNRLGVYRDGPTVAGGDPQPTASPNSVSLEGQVYDDGWAGRSFSVVVADPQCTKLAITLTPFPAVQSAQGTPLGDGEISRGSVEALGVDRQLVQLSDNEVPLEFPIGVVPTVIAFEFERSWQPKSLAINDDVRELVTLVRAECVPPPVEGTN